MPTKIVVSRFNFVAMIDSNFLTVYYPASGTSNCKRNYGRARFTALASHPTEPMIATGDSGGQIQLWRNLFETDFIRTVYHWHATPVKSVTFSEHGSNFYSGAKEFVLVKWVVDRPDLKDFLPRMRGAPVHIAVGPRNNRLAVALSDNEIQLLSTNFDMFALIQNFTYVHDDETGLDLFPCGLQLSPRNKCLVLNGRPGQLQFFSTQSKSLLYNVSIKRLRFD